MRWTWPEGPIPLEIDPSLASLQLASAAMVAFTFSVAQDIVGLVACGRFQARPCSTISY